MELPTNTFFIGEIVNIYSEERYLRDSKPDVKKIAPFLLTMPDNRFWSVGDPCRIGVEGRGGIS